MVAAVGECPACDTDPVNDDRNVFVPVWSERLLRIVLQKAIRTGVRLLGQPVSEDVAWATGPIGPDRIGERIYDDYAKRHHLTIARADDAGLLPSFASLDGPGFSAEHLHPSIRHFYEHTSEWEMDVEVRWRGPLRFSAQTLLYVVSREIEQLNVPLSQSAVSDGISSEILPLLASDGHRPYTGWLRRFKGDGSVIYAGFYTYASVPGIESPCVKVCFPVPQGCTTVILRPENRPGGGLRLTSSGKRFGDPGAYRLHGSGDEPRVAYVPIHERFDLWSEDGTGEVRCDHHFALWRFHFLTLRYRMRRR